MNKENPNNWPKWRFQSLWRQKRGPWPGENHLGPFSHEIYARTAPTAAMGGVQFNLPVEFIGASKKVQWECVCVFGVQMIQKGAEMPIENPSKTTLQ